MTRPHHSNYSGFHRIDRDALIPLVDVPGLSILEPIRKSRGRKHHISTVVNWWRKGLNGVHLNTQKVGRVRCTTEKDLVEFFERSGMLDRSPRPSQPDRRRTKRQKQARHSVQRKLYGAIFVAITFIHPTHGANHANFPIPCFNQPLVAGGNSATHPRTTPVEASLTPGEGRDRDSRPLKLVSQIKLASGHRTKIYMEYSIMDTAVLAEKPLDAALIQLRDNTSDSELDAQIASLKSTLNADDSHPTVAAMIACKTEREAGARRAIGDAVIKVANDAGIKLEHPVGPEEVKAMAVGFGITAEDLKDYRRQAVFEFVAGTPGGATIQQTAKELNIQSMTARGDLTELVTSKRLELNGDRYIAPPSS